MTYREKLAGRLIGFAAHDDDCTVNRFPGHDACSCGLSSLIQEARHAAALRQSPSVEEVALTILTARYNDVIARRARARSLSVWRTALKEAQAIADLYGRGG